MKIKSAAIIYKDIVYSGRSHCEIGHKMLSDNVCPRPFPGGVAQGFITDEDKFVSREEAFKIAMEAKQIVVDKTYHSKELFSEDLNYPKK